ncbi:hypothetical protein C8R46DRAFT_1361968 [Mycena filopes]|nr:hypothetical protein C8R46DRAFT_1361968 [Mycena filopes]
MQRDKRVRGEEEHPQLPRSRASGSVPCIRCATRPTIRTVSPIARAITSPTTTSRSTRPTRARASAAAASLRPRPLSFCDRTLSPLARADFAPLQHRAWTGTRASTSAPLPRSHHIRALDLRVAQHYHLSSLSGGTRTSCMLTTLPTGTHTAPICRHDSNSAAASARSRAISSAKVMSTSSVSPYTPWRAHILRPHTRAHRRLATTTHILATRALPHATIAPSICEYRMYDAQDRPLPVPHGLQLARRAAHYRLRRLRPLHNPRHNFARARLARASAIHAASSPACPLGDRTRDSAGGARRGRRGPGRLQHLDVPPTRVSITGRPTIRPLAHSTNTRTHAVSPLQPRRNLARARPTHAPPPCAPPAPPFVHLAVALSIEAHSCAESAALQPLRTSTTPQAAPAGETVVVVVVREVREDADLWECERLPAVVAEDGP